MSRKAIDKGWKKNGKIQTFNVNGKRKQAKRGKKVNKDKNRG